MNILYVNSLEANNKELARQLASANVLIAEQNKLAKERQEWALHTNEVIRGLNQQLAAAIAACKLKDEAFKEISGDCGTSIAILNRAWSVCKKALAIQPDDAALKAWLGEPEWFYRKNESGVNIFYEDVEERPAGCTPLYSPKGLK